LEAIKSLNLALRFILEMGALGAVGFWGFQLDRGAAAKWIVGIGAPLLVVIVWSLFIAPGSDNALPQTTRMWIGTAVLAACAAALMAARQPLLAGVFAAAIVANAVLMQVWQQ
jgi:hypothetical protein